MEETIVTMFFNLKDFENKDRRDVTKYMEDSKFLLSQNINLVIFTQPQYVKQIEEIRYSYFPLLEKGENKEGKEGIKGKEGKEEIKGKEGKEGIKGKEGKEGIKGKEGKEGIKGKEGKTKIIEMEIEELPHFHLYESVKNARQVNPMRNGNPNKDTPIYTILTWAKLALMRKVIDMNPFNSTHFAWCDFGIGYVAKKDFVEKDKIFSNFPDDIKLLSLRPIYTVDLAHNNFTFNPNFYYAFERGIVAAGYITGKSDRWILFHKLFESEIKQCLSIQIAPSEQQLFPIIMLKNNSLFSTYRGDYCDILSNYRHFRMGIDNVYKYTMLKCRELENFHLSSSIGYEIFSQIKRGIYFYNASEYNSSDSSYNPEEEMLIAVFLNELYFSLIKVKLYGRAEEVRKFYSGAKFYNTKGRKEKSKVKEFIP